MVNAQSLLRTRGTHLIAALLPMLLCPCLAGCSNPLWTQAFLAKNPAPAPPPPPAEQLAQSPPVPAPALYIGGEPQPLADAARKSEVVPVVQFQEMPQKSDADPVVAMRRLYRQSADKFSSLTTYRMRLQRREVIGGKQMPLEIMDCRFRNEPWSVYFKWVGEVAKGREVVYVKNQYKNEIYTLLAAGDHFFKPAGSRFSISHDHFLLRNKTRYPITDAGLGPMIERFGRLVRALEKGDPSQGSAQYVGLVKRPEFPAEVVQVRQTIPPGGKADSTLPAGGQRLWFFDTTLRLPTLIIAMDETGREVEYYCHDRFWFNFPVTDDDFNPDRLWPNAK